MNITSIDQLLDGLDQPAYARLAAECIDRLRDIDGIHRVQEVLNARRTFLSSLVKRAVREGDTVQFDPGRDRPIVTGVVKKINRSKALVIESLPNGRTSQWNVPFALLRIWYNFDASIAEPEVAPEIALTGEVV